MLTDTKYKNACRKARETFEVARARLIEVTSVPKALVEHYILPDEQRERAWSNYAGALHDLVSVTMTGQLHAWKFEEWLFDVYNRAFHFELHGVANLYSREAEAGLPDRMLQVRASFTLDPKLDLDAELARVADEVAFYVESVRTMGRESLRAAVRAGEVPS